MKRAATPFRLLMILLATTALATPALAKKKVSKAHQHGHARLDVAVEGTTVEAELEIPGDGIFGFEHAPKTDAQKKIVEDGLKVLRDKASEMIALPAEAGCKATEIEVESSLEEEHHQKGESHKEDKHHAHSEVDVFYSFTCTKSPVGGSLTLGLMKAFPRIKQVKVQVVSGTTQKGTTVKSDKDVVSL